MVEHEQSQNYHFFLFGVDPLSDPANGLIDHGFSRVFDCAFGALSAPEARFRRIAVDFGQSLSTLLWHVLEIVL